MNIKYINSLYPDVKNKNPKLYISSLETLVTYFEEKIQMLESCVINNEKTIAEYRKLFDEAMTEMKKRRVEMYGDNENDGELMKAFNDGFKQALEQGATYENPTGNGYITADGVDRRTGENVDEKTH